MGMLFVEVWLIVWVMILQKVMKGKEDRERERGFIYEMTTISSTHKSPSKQQLPPPPLRTLLPIGIPSPPQPRT